MGKKRKVQEISLTKDTDKGEKKKDGKKKRNEVPDITTITSTITTSASMKDGDKNALDNSSTNGDDGSEMTGDTVLYCIMHNAKLDCFNKLDDTSPIIEKYKAMTGNRLRIQQCLVDKFRVYRCTSHEACPFLVRFSKQPKDGKFILTKMNPKHGNAIHPNPAADGRQLNKRHQGKIEEVVLRVLLQTKDGPPVPVDIINSASNKEYNENLPYMAAWCAINHDIVCQKRASLMNFQLIIPYLEEMYKSNPLSIIGYTRGSACNIVEDLNFFPAIANDVLKRVRSVISLDAAHLRSEHNGMLYIASVLSGGDAIYPIGFIISTGNEDRKTCTKMLELLKEACPIISQHAFSAVNPERDTEDADAPPEA